MIDKVIIHCSDSDFVLHDNVETIKKWHLARGMFDIAYHYVITKDGICHPGRNLWVPGAHCKGFNIYSIGVCLTGKSIFSKAQFVTLIEVWKRLSQIFDLGDGDLYHHRDFNKRKTCPNFDLKDLF